MFGTSEAIDVTPSRIVFLLMLSMLVGMKDSNVKFLINDLAACQDKKIYYVFSTAGALVVITLEGVSNHPLHPSSQTFCSEASYSHIAYSHGVLTI